jgi:8-oxo-dGTP pyrophosphatase MutT (NUDIX family)
MTTPAARPGRPDQHLPVRVRAVLLTGHGSIIVIARHRPGRAAYRVLPGGAVEATDPSPEAALARELHEELGAHAVIGPRLATITAAMHDGTMAIQHLHLANLVTLDPAQATAPEYTDPATGTYTLEELPLDITAVRQANLLPQQAIDLLIDLLSDPQRSSLLH